MGDNSLYDYIERHIDREPEHLHELDRDTNLELLNGRMCSGHLQGRVLKMLVRMINPLRVLELGTFSGHSAMCLAEGLQREGAVVHTVEIDDELEDFIARHLEQCPWRERIVTHIGDAGDIVPRLGLTFDLVYIDANKRHYTEYYRLAMDHLSDGGFIIADNTLWDGKVATADDGHTDPQTQGIVDFNELVASDPRVETVILPLRDGLTILHKL